MPAPLPVLALHGFLGRGSDWDAVAAELGSRLVAPDLPGHGAAVGLPEAAYTMDGAARHALAALDAERAVVAGYSMGGRLALHLAVRHPERVAALVLLSASPGLRTEAERAARRGLDAERAAALAADLPGFLRRWAELPIWGGLSERDRAAFVRRRRANDPVELGRSLRGMGTGAMAPLWAGLSRIRVPVWAVAGGEDARYVALADAMARAAPVRVHLIPGAGHALLDQAPAAVARVLARATAVPPL